MSTREHQSRRNRDVIAMSGFSHGGTSLIWNVLNSHPAICAPRIETNQIVERNRGLRLLFNFPRSLRGRRGRTPRWWVDRELHRLKLAALDQGALGERVPGEAYSLEEASATKLSLKSIDGGIRLTETLLSVYPDLAIICVPRHGLAVLESAVRRGMEPELVGRRYGRNGARMIELSLRHRRSMIVKFDEFLEAPARIAIEMYRFVGLQEQADTSFRLKAKGVIGNDGAHEPRFGVEGNYYWITQSKIASAIDREIDQRQIARVKARDAKAFLKHAQPVMRSFGYSDE